MEMLAKRLDDIISEHDREFHDADEAVHRAHQQRTDTAVAAHSHNVVVALGNMILDKRKNEVAAHFQKNTSTRRQVTSEEEGLYRSAMIAVISSSYPDPVKPAKSDNDSSNNSVVTSLPAHLSRYKIPASGTYAKLAGQILARAQKYRIPASTIFSLLDVMYVPIVKKINRLDLSTKKDAALYQRLYDTIIDVLLSQQSQKSPGNTVNNPLSVANSSVSHSSEVVIKTPCVMVRLQRIF